MNALSFLNRAMLFNNTGFINSAMVLDFAKSLKTEEIMLLIIIVTLCLGRKCDIYFIIMLIVIFFCDFKKGLRKP